MNVADHHRELIGRFLEGGLADAETTELGRALATDPALAEALARACRVDACLAVHFSIQAQALDMTTAVSGRGTFGQTASRRLPARWVAAAVVTIAVLVGWTMSRRPYPGPRVTGRFTDSDGESIRRGTVLRTADAQREALTLGGYCRVDVDPDSVVRVAGSPRRERIVLERGRVACDIEPGAGQFTVETKHCTVSVRGTRFAVELLESQGGHAMLGKHVLVKVFAGAVLVAAAGAQETVNAGEEKLVPGKVVVTAEDQARSVGDRWTYAVTTPDGKPVGKADVAIVGKHTVGSNTLHRAAVRFGTQRRPDYWFAVGDDGYFHFDAFGATLPGDHFPLPLKEGMAFEYESTQGKVSARVVGTEAVEVPAGKFACLAVESKYRVDGEERTRTSWVAPDIGTVKHVRHDVTLALAGLNPVVVLKPEKGAVVLNTFDTDEPLRSPLFARARWGGWMGEPGRSSDVDIDAFTGGANGTPFCLRWTYTTLGTWVSASISPGGERPADLSKYAGISFYIKGLLGKPCTMTIQAKAADGEERAFAHIRFPVTQRWQKIILTHDTHPQLLALDLRKVYSIGLTDAAREGAAHNVIWLDEVKLHEDEQLLIEEINALEKAKLLLEAHKAEF
ncbi:MAG: FecR domain-containing protein [Candidatus Brocadiae bacterium]|nr:FecR domain-containing protein [Candidatus Brocadiia bacterium]